MHGVSSDRDTIVLSQSIQFFRRFTRGYYLPSRHATVNFVVLFLQTSFHIARVMVVLILLSVSHEIQSALDTSSEFTVVQLDFSSELDNVVRSISELCGGDYYYHYYV